MPVSGPQPFDSELNLSRAGTVIVTALVCGFIAITVASSIGPHAVQLLILSTLIVLFVAGGGLLGLLITHHVAETHLPDEAPQQARSKQQAPETEFSEEETRGVLALFKQTGSPETPTETHQRRAA